MFHFVYKSQWFNVILSYLPFSIKYIWKNSLFFMVTFPMRYRYHTKCPFRSYRFSCKNFIDTLYNSDLAIEPETLVTLPVLVLSIHVRTLYYHYKSSNIKVIRTFFVNHNKSFRWHLGDYEKHIFFHLKACERRIFDFCVFLWVCSVTV